MGACHVRVVQVHDFGLKSFCGIPGGPLIVSSMVSLFFGARSFSRLNLLERAECVVMNLCRTEREDTMVSGTLYRAKVETYIPGKVLNMYKIRFQAAPNNGG